MRTTEQMIEEIKEKVIMANNPECKTYDEALEGIILLSTKIRYQYTTSHLNWGYAPPDLDYYEHEGYTEAPERCKKYEAFIFHDINGVYFPGDFYDEHDLYYRKLLGKDYILIEEIYPLYDVTLERVLVCLNKDCKEINDYLSCGEYIYDKNDNDIIISWQPNKTLENQSEETIQQIYEILC